MNMKSLSLTFFSSLKQTLCTETSEKERNPHQRARMNEGVNAFPKF